MKTLITAIVAILVVWGLVRMMHKNPADMTNNATSTQSLMASSTEDMAVDTYVRQNISSLAPTKEQLGGTFYVTSLETNNGTGTVSYEDGHNSYTADFTYAMSATGTPTIRTFNVR
jgi:hypothetical protein